MSRQLQLVLFYTHHEPGGVTYSVNGKGRFYSDARRMPIEPFTKWLTEVKAAEGWTTSDMALLIGVDAKRVRVWLNEGIKPQKQVLDRTVEKVGIALVQDPRIAEQLYPELTNEGETT